MSGQPATNELAAGFNAMFAAIATSAVYSDAVHAADPELPDWLVPYSFVTPSALGRFARELDIGAGNPFLDIACGMGGPGIWVAEQTGAALVGVDFSEAATKAARLLAGVRGSCERARFIVADATATGLPDSTFVGIMSIDSIHFMDPEAIARETSRLLRPGGRAIFTTWEAVTEWLPRPTMVRDYRPVFKNAGLAIRLHEYPLDARERELAFFRAIVERAEALDAEIGAMSKKLLDEASKVLAEYEREPRVRKVILAVEKTHNRMTIAPASLAKNIGYGFAQIHPVNPDLDRLII